MRRIVIYTNNNSCLLYCVSAAHNESISILFLYNVSKAQIGLRMSYFHIIYYNMKKKHIIHCPRRLSSVLIVAWFFSRAVFFTDQTSTWVAFYCFSILYRTRNITVHYIIIVRVDTCVTRGDSKVECNDPVRDNPFGP